KQRDELIGYRVAPARKIVSIPLGLDIEPMLSAEAERGRLRAELGLNGVHRLVGIVARLVPIKAHEVFIEAAARIRREVPNVRFLIIGDGKRRAEVVANGRSGLLVPPRDPGALAEAVTTILSEPGTGERLANAARRAVYPKYSSERLVADVETLYLRLARAKGLATA